MARARRKADLPVRICQTCGRPFAWRRKWARVWDEVRHCSERCRRNRRGPPVMVDGGAVAGGDASGDADAPAGGRAPAGAKPASSAGPARR